MAYPLITLFKSSYGSTRLSEFRAVTNREHPDLEIVFEWDELCQFHHGGDYGPPIIQPLSAQLSPTQWANISAQCIGNKAVFQIIGEGITLKDCVHHVGRLNDTEILTLVPSTWSIQIKHLGKLRGLPQSEGRVQIEEFSHVLSILAERPVQLEQPDAELWLLKDCRRLETSETSSQMPDIHYHWLLKRIKPTVHAHADELATSCDIKERSFIATTTLPSDRGLLMANLAQVRAGDCILDPFCGSGGLLITSALLGAKVVGGDINKELLTHEDKALPLPSSRSRPNRGIEKVSYGDSFKDLGLALPILVVGADIQDPAVIQRYLEANRGQRYDALITDPPYGIRESRSHMSSSDIVACLCKLARDLLKVGGKIVFLQTIKGKIQQVEQRQELIKQELESVLEAFPIRLQTVTIERFNTRRLRATVVLVKTSSFSLSGEA